MEKDQIRSNNQTLKRLLEVWSVNLNPNIKTSYIKDLAAMIKTTAPQELWEKALEKWLLATVSNLLIDNFCTNRFCLVLAGYNARAFIHNLWPADHPAYVFKGRIGFDPLVLGQKFLINLLPPFPTARQQEGFNFFQQVLNLDRIPLSTKEDIPRIANFCAAVPAVYGLAVDSEQILCFELLEPINAKALKAIDMTQVWGEAYRLLRAGKNYLWQTKEKAALKAYQKRFKYGQITSLEKTALLKKFKVATIEEHDLCLSTMQIFRRLEKDFAKLNPARLDWELKQLGCEYELDKDGLQVKGWYLDWAKKEE